MADILQTIFPMVLLFSRQWFSTRSKVIYMCYMLPYDLSYCTVETVQSCAHAVVKTLFTLLYTPGVFHLIQSFTSLLTGRFTHGFVPLGVVVDFEPFIGWWLGSLHRGLGFCLPCIFLWIFYIIKGLILLLSFSSWGIWICLPSSVMYASTFLMQGCRAWCR